MLLILTHYTNYTICLNRYPVKAVLVAFLLLCFVQFGGFGVKFVFAEATGVQDISGRVENNGILKGVKMPAEKAQWMTEISAFVEEEQLQGQEVILYGDIPSLSFYLGMPSAFNPWSDLDSYSQASMEEDMAELETELAEGAEYPVVIFDKAVFAKDKEDAKQALLMAYMDKYGYIVTFENDKFALYEAEKRN